MYEDGICGNPTERTSKEDLVGIVSKGIWRVLTCPVRMLRIGIIGD